MNEPLRLCVYDRTCRGRRGWFGLSHVWAAGIWLYRALGRIDAGYGAASWEEALDWLASYEPQRPIGEVQLWMHGKWGAAKIGAHVLNCRSLGLDDPLGRRLRDVVARLVPEGLWWFRTCETFGGHAGHAFARAMADTIGCRVAGHTYIIGHLQSGLHSLRPGQTPEWSPDEGLLEGTAHEPTRAKWSRWFAPNTISFLRGKIPRGY